MLNFNMNNFICLTLKSAFWLVICPYAAMAGNFYDGFINNKITLEEIALAFRPRQVVVASEFHGNPAHHKNQLDILKIASKKINNISVGMEFFEYPHQELVDQFLAGILSEFDFLKAIQWKGNFGNYRDQVLFAKNSEGLVTGTTRALNFPRRLSGKVAKGGLNNLTDEEKKMIPPRFALGKNSYFERFANTMKEHATPEQIQNYFAAQSLWDDSMAWQTSEYLKSHPNDFFVIIVGEFHLAYLDGLVARLRAYGLNDVLAISQIDTTHLSAEESESERRPHPIYGPRADYIFDSR